MRLQPLSPGSTTWSEEESRKNFDAVRRMVVPGSVKSMLLVHPLALDPRKVTYDLGNSSGISIARHTVFVTSQTPNAGSRLFAFRVPPA